MDSQSMEGMRVSFWGEFVSPETEALFLEQSRRHRILMTLLAVGAGLLETLIFIPSDRQILGTSEIVSSLLQARLAFAVVSAGMLAAQGIHMRGPTANRLLLAWAMLAVILQVYVGSTRPSVFFLGYGFTGLFALLSVYFIMPLPFRWQVMLAAIATIVDLSLLTRHGDFHPVLRRAFIVGYIFTNIVAAIGALSLHRLRRGQFVALREEAALRGNLEAMVAEVKTLRGILPICSYCKRVRESDGFWEQLEIYVRNHSDAEFSHGICPECVETHFKQYVRKPKDIN